MTDEQKEKENQKDALRGPYDKFGPQSVHGVEASDLPDKGRGSVETDFGKEAARNLPQQTGEGPFGQVGLRGHPDLAQADERGGRKKN